jgi:hypothetical protein
VKPTRNQFLAGLHRKALLDAVALERIGSPFAAMAWAHADGFAVLRALGENGSARHAGPGPVLTEPLTSVGAGTRGSVMHVGGPRDGLAEELPEKCPCCLRPLVSGTIVTFKDGSCYLLDLRGAEPYAFYLAPALFGAKA